MAQKKPAKDEKQKVSRKKIKEESTIEVNGNVFQKIPHKVTNDTCLLTKNKIY